MGKAKSIRGIRSKELRRLRPILEQWIETVEQCVQCWKQEDVPWWYGERPCLSLFAGAIWKAHGLAFEEYASEKHFGRKVGAYRGRADLYFQFSKEGFVAEAKQAWSWSKPGEFDSSVHINDRLDKACEDMVRCVSAAERKLGLVFTGVQIARKHCQQIDPLISRWVDSLKRVEASAYAYVFPESTRNFGWQESLWPGGALFIRECGSTSGRLTKE